MTFDVTEITSGYRELVIWKLRIAYNASLFNIQDKKRVYNKYFYPCETYDPFEIF